MEVEVTVPPRPRKLRRRAQTLDFLPRGAFTGWRWLVLLSFVPLIASREIGIPGANGKLVVTGIAAAISCAILLTQLGQPAVKTLWCWSLLFVFLAGYYLKLPLFLNGFSSEAFMLLHTDLVTFESEDLIDALVWSTVGFATFCLTSTVLLARSRLEATIRFSRPRSEEVIPERLLKLIGFTVAAVAIASFIQITYGFGIMGQEVVTLPFRTEKLLNRYRMALAPMFIMLFLWITDNRRLRRFWLLSLAVILLMAISDSVIRSSRGSLILFLIPVGLLWILSKTLSRGRVALGVAALVLTVLLYPVISLQRWSRASGGNVMEAIQEGGIAFGRKEAILFGIDQLSTRVSGVEWVAHIVRFRPPNSGGAFGTTIDAYNAWRIVNAERLFDYMTAIVMDAPRETEGRPATMVGALILLGGVDGLILGMILFPTALWYFWNRLAAHPLAPPVLAFIASSVIFYSMEGGYGFQDPLTWTIAVYIVSEAYKRWLIATIPGRSEGWASKPALRRRARFHPQALPTLS